MEAEDQKQLSLGSQHIGPISRGSAGSAGSAGSRAGAGPHPERCFEPPGAGRAAADAADADASAAPQRVDEQPPSFEPGPFFWAPSVNVLLSNLQVSHSPQGVTFSAERGRPRHSIFVGLSKNCRWRVLVGVLTD